MLYASRRTKSALRHWPKKALVWSAMALLLFCLLFLATPLSAAPPKLLSGTPKVPEVGNIDADLIRFSAEIDDADDIAIFPDKLQWRHLSGTFPKNIRVNGIEWDPQKKQTLPVAEKPGMIPKDFIQLGSGLDPLRLLRGRIQFQTEPEYLYVWVYDWAPGADRIEFAIRPGEHLTPVTVNDETTARIAELYAANPHQPHPAGKDALTRKDLKKLEARWRHTRLAGAYEKHGSHNAAWDKQAAAFLELAGQDQAAPLPELVAAGEATLNLGCDDPLVCALLGEALWRMNQPARAEELLVHAVLAFENGKYPARVTRRAPGLLARMIRGESDEKRKLGEGLMARCIDETVQMLSEPFSDGEQRAVLHELESDVGDGPFDLLRGNRARLLRVMCDSTDCDPWVSHVLQGSYQIEQGWQSRGAGWASTVTEGGWQDFGQLLDQARIHLVEAWRLHPEFPEAALHLITTTKAIGGIEEESARFWFDQAVAAQMDVFGAHGNLLQALLPRWGGSHEEVMKFGLECLRTGRFDTPVPLNFYNAAWSIIQEEGDARALLKEFDGEQDALDAFESYTKQSTEFLSISTILTENAALAWSLGMTDVAKGYLDRVGDDLDAAALQARGVDPKVLVSDLSTPSLSAEKAPERLPLGTLLKNPAPIFSMAIAADGSQIAASSHDEDHYLTLWDVSKGTHEALTVDNEMVPFHLAFSPNGEHLASLQFGTVIGRNNAQIPWATVSIWDLDKKTRRELLPRERFQLTGLAWLPDGRHIATGSTMPNTFSPFGVRIWNAETGKLVAGAAAKEVCGEVAVSPDGKLLALGLAGGAIRLLPLPDKEALKAAEKKAIPLGADIATLEKHVKAVTLLSFSADGRWLASSSYEDRSIWIWDLKEKRPMHRLEGSLLAFSPDGKRIATAEGPKLSQQGAIWDVETGKPLLRLVNADAAFNRSLAYTADGAFIVMGGTDAAIRTWEAEVKE